MTLAPNVLAKIDRLTGQWVDEGKMFTAFEISLAMKEQGVTERHRNLKSAIHESLAKVAGANYSRTLMDVGAPSQAWVYHKLRDNPYNYEPLDRSGFEDSAKRAKRTTPTITPRDPKPLRAGSQSPRTNTDGVYGMDSQGNLKIPQSMLVQLGVASGETVWIVCDTLNEEIRIKRPSQINPEKHDAEEKVSPDGTLVLKYSLLKAVALDGLQCYQILSGGNQITIGSVSDD